MMKTKILHRFLLSVCISIFVNILYGQTPTISGFSPSSGSVGTLVTITGTGLDNPTGFAIAGVNAIVISNTGTQLVGMVMPGATTGQISITTSGGTANSASNFTVTASQVPNAQQGSKLVGTGAIGNAAQGLSVSISSDANS
ncbi:MAG: IPT/TIG domain-containing protein, partial [Bacteroidota bacterium]|nr:IPT/TIG domain-containing protein [Bacteroidota bacterium]